MIADDHEGARKAIRSILQTRPDIYICGEAVDGQEAVQQTLQLEPDLVVLDVWMPRKDGFAAATEIKNSRPHIPVLMISTASDEDMISAAKQAGAQGFIPKVGLYDLLLKAVDALLQGHTFFSLDTHSP